MKKYVIASVLCLALGPFVPGHAHAEDGSNHHRHRSYNRDTTPPLITAEVSGTKGNNGWYTSDVSVSWQVSDPDSSISSTSGCEVCLPDHGYHRRDLYLFGYQQWRHQQAISYCQTRCHPADHYHLHPAGR